MSLNKHRKNEFRTMYRTIDFTKFFRKIIELYQYDCNLRMLLVYSEKKEYLVRVDN